MDIAISFPGNKKVDAQVQTFTIHTDQSKKEEGTNTAPSPFQHFIASIGNCTGYYVLTFCQQRNIPTHNIHLNLTAERNNQTHMINTITIKIQVPTDFPPKYEKALLRTASLCTVKKHLEKPPQINLRVSLQ